MTTNSLKPLRYSRPILKYDLRYTSECPGRRPGEHQKNAEEGEEVEEALTRVRSLLR